MRKTVQERKVSDTLSMKFVVGVIHLQIQLTSSV